MHEKVALRGRMGPAICIVLLLMMPLAARGQSALADRPTADSLAGLVPDLAEAVQPAVVQIYTTGFGATTQGTAGLLGQESATGSGVIVDSTGYIVTNHHVIEGARRIQVRLASPRATEINPQSVLKPGGELYVARVVGSDLETDLAVLKIEAGGLPSLPFGDSEGLRQGQLVFAFGSPFGLGGSVSMGIVSAVARQLEDDAPVIYIQSDVAVNPGNSGGPLVDIHGYIVGINSFILSPGGGSDGLSFAVPSDLARNVYEQIRSHGRVRRGGIGVYAQTINPVLAKGLSLQRSWGVILGDVYPNGPADVAGLRPGDQVLTLDGKTMENGRQFAVNVYAVEAGASVKLEILRDGKIRTVKVQVLELPGDPTRFAEYADPSRNTIRKLGILGLDLSDEIKRMFGRLRSDKGVVVGGILYPVSIETGGLVSGDIIRTINGNKVSNVAELQDLLRALSTGQAAVLQIERGLSLRYVSVRIDG